MQQPREWKPEEFKDMPKGHYLIWQEGSLSGVDLVLWTRELLFAFINTYEEPKITRAYGPFYK
jgi:hypothetical protein